MLFAWIAATVAITAPTRTATAGEFTWEEGREFVKLIERDGRTDGRNHHPVKIRPATLARILAMLETKPRVSRRTSDRMLKKSDDERLPLFSQGTATLLGRKMSQALHKTDPGQDVVFQVAGITPLVGNAIGKQVLTTGRVFWDGRHLHVIFGTIHKGVKERWLYGQRTNVVSPRYPGTRVQARSLPVQIVPRPGVTPLKSGKRVRYDWIKIDPRVMLAENGTVKKKRKKPAQRPKRTERSEKAERAEHDDDSQLERDLSRLKRLRDLGMISQTIYKEEVRRLLREH